MEEHNGYELIPVLGMNVDAVSVPSAVEISKSYVENDYFNFVLLAGARLAMSSQESEQVREFIKCADLILPGDHDIEKAIAMNQEGHYCEEFIDQLLTKLAQDQKTMCILCKTAEQCQKAEEYLEHDYDGLTIHAVVYDKDSDAAMETIVNTLNGYLPDVVLPLVPMEMQQKLLLAHKETICTKLYLCSERVTSQIFVDIVDQEDDSRLVKWIKKKLNLGSERITTEFWQKFDQDVTE